MICRYMSLGEYSWFNVKIKDYGIKQAFWSFVHFEYTFNTDCKLLYLSSLDHKDPSNQTVFNFRWESSNSMVNVGHLQTNSEKFRPFFKCFSSETPRNLTVCVSMTTKVRYQLIFLSFLMFNKVSRFKLISLQFYKTSNKRLRKAP